MRAATLLGIRLPTRLGTQIDAGDLTPFATMLSLARWAVSGDLFIVDGISGKVRSIVDHLDGTHIFDQSDTARQVAVPAPHADFNGNACYTNTTAIGACYASNKPLSYWNSTADGSGIEIIDARTYTSNITNQCMYRTTSNGVQAGTINIVTGVNISNEVRGVSGVNRLTLASAPLLLNTPVVHRFSHATADSPQCRGRVTNSVSEATGPYTGALATTPGVTMAILGLNVSSLPFQGRLRWLAGFVTLTPTQRDWFLSTGLSI